MKLLFKVSRSWPALDASSSVFSVISKTNYQELCVIKRYVELTISVSNPEFRGESLWFLAKTNFSLFGSGSTMEITSISMGF